MLSFEDAQRLASRLRDELGRAIIGQQAVVQEILTVFVAGGHCLLRGVPGLAKTLLIKTLAQAVHLKFNRIQFTPDLMPSDIIGTEVIEEDRATGRRTTRFIPGPVFANLILAGWPENPYGGFMSEARSDPLLPSLAALGEPRLIRAYLSEVLPKDASLDPGKALVKVCETDGWATYQAELEAVFQKTTIATLARTVGMLEEICLANPRKKEGWIELCEALGKAAVQALDHALVCPKENVLDCPNFWATMKGILAGVDLVDAHANVHAAPGNPGASDG